MPYKSIDDLPNSLDGLPRGAKEVWLSVFNSAYDGDEEKAIKTAWAAVKKKYRKDDDGKWRKQSATDSITRQLRLNISGSKYVERDGGLLVKDVKLLAEGTWTDSHVQTPLYYPDETLRKYSTNWIDYSLWSRHSGGQPRSIIDKIGEIENPRYGSSATMGDLFYHCRTQTSRDAAEYTKYCIDSGTALFVSVEHGGKEVWNPSERRYEASEIVFGGCAVVNQGACKVCQINNEDPTYFDYSDSSLEDEYLTDTKELEDKIKELEGVIETRDARIKELEQPPVVESGTKELEAKIAELETQFKELSEKMETFDALDNRVKELESKPDPKTTVAGVEFGIGKPMKSITIKNGEITRSGY